MGNRQSTQCKLSFIATQNGLGHADRSVLFPIFAMCSICVDCQFVVRASTWSRTAKIRLATSDQLVLLVEDDATNTAIEMIQEYRKLQGSAASSMVNIIFQSPTPPPIVCGQCNIFPVQCREIDARGLVRTAVFQLLPRVSFQYTALMHEQFDWMYNAATDFARSLTAETTHAVVFAWVRSMRTQYQTRGKPGLLTVSPTVVKLIDVSPTGQCQVTDKVQALLSGSLPLNIVTVVGPAGSGKSFLLSHILQLLFGVSSFQSAPSMNPVTFGADIFSVQFPISSIVTEFQRLEYKCDAVEDDCPQVMFADTEGSGAVSTNRFLSCVVPVLLVSHTVLYNFLVAGIRLPVDDLLEGLNALMSVGDQLKVSSTRDQPWLGHLVIVCRDWLGTVSETEEAQRLILENEVGVTSRNEIRTRLRHCFRSVRVMGVPPPQNKSCRTIGQPTPEYSKAVLAVLGSQLHLLTKPHSIDKVPMTASVMQRVLLDCVKQCQDGRVLAPFSSFVESAQTALYGTLLLQASQYRALWQEQVYAQCSSQAQYLDLERQCRSKLEEILDRRRFDIPSVSGLADGFFQESESFFESTRRWNADRFHRSLLDRALASAKELFAAVGRPLSRILIDSMQTIHLELRGHADLVPGAISGFLNNLHIRMLKELPALMLIRNERAAIDSMKRTLLSGEDSSPAVLFVAFHWLKQNEGNALLEELARLGGSMLPDASGQFLLDFAASLQPQMLHLVRFDNLMMYLSLSLRSHRPWADLVRSFVDTHPKPSMRWDRLAAIYSNVDLDEAAICFAKALQERPIQSVLNYSSFLIQQGRTNEGVVYQIVSSHLNPGDDDVWLRMAQLLTQPGLCEFSQRAIQSRFRAFFCSSSFLTIQEIWEGIASRFPVPSVWKRCAEYYEQIGDLDRHGDFLRMCADYPDSHQVVNCVKFAMWLQRTRQPEQKFRPYIERAMLLEPSQSLVYLASGLVEPWRASELFQRVQDRESMLRLHSAVNINDIVTVKDLLSTSFSSAVNQLGNDGQGPLHLATLRGHFELVHLLIAAEADVNLQSVDGATSLLLACDMQDERLVSCLLEAKADVHLSTREHLTPLIRASGTGHHFPTARLLLEAKANVDDALQDLSTSLHNACFSANFEIVVLLVEHSADVLATDVGGLIPSQCADRVGFPNISEYLRPFVVRRLAERMQQFVRQFWDTEPARLF